MAYSTKPTIWSVDFWDQRLFLMAALVLLSGFVLYVFYVSIMVTAAEQIKKLVVVSPLLLVVAVHWLSSMPNQLSLSLPRAQPAAARGADGFPWGVALVLLLLLFLISYQPSFYPRWFAL